MLKKIMQHDLRYASHFKGGSSVWDYPDSFRAFHVEFWRCEIDVPRTYAYV